MNARLYSKIQKKYGDCSNIWGQTVCKGLWRHMNHDKSKLFRLMKFHTDEYASYIENFEI